MNETAALSLTCSIGWSDSDVILMRGTEVVGSEGIACLSNVCAVCAVHNHWVVFICHVLDKDRVPDIIIHTSHIQRPGSSPGDGD